MHDKPATLEDFCIDALCDSVHAMCGASYDNQKFQAESDNNSSNPTNLQQQTSTSFSQPTSINQNTCQQFTSSTSDDETNVKATSVDNCCDQHQNATPNNYKTDNNCCTPEIVVPVLVSDKLLWRLCEKNQLTNKTMTFFNAKRTTLKNVKIADCPVSHVGLEILREHTLESLKLINLKDVQLDRVILESINSETLHSLQILDLTGTLRPTRIRSLQQQPQQTATSGNELQNSNCPPDNEIIVDNVHLLCKFRNLRALCVAETLFSDSGLVKICDNMKFLEYLDISHTRVTDVQPLIVYADQLRTLLMHRPRVRNVVETVEILVELRRLEVLEISDFPKMNQPSSSADGFRGHLGVSLVQNSINADDVRLKCLRILDLSGSQANFDVNVFSNFLVTHNSLEYCGLLMSNACYFDAVLALTHLKVAGEANKNQIFVSLETYWSRDFFCSRSMYLLFSMLQDDYQTLSTDEKHFCIKNIVKGLTVNMNSLSVQMAGTACLYNLCKGERAQNVHPALLHQIVERSLIAVETHSKTLQLHKNVWLTLCNDHILQSGTFDMFRCCSAALESMIRCADNSVTRMTVAIVSILAAKIPTELTTKLGTNHLYMRFLLHVVNQKVEQQTDWYKEHARDIENDPTVEQHAPPPDITLKFTLSALWNLTDESPSTCLCFLEENGLEIVLKVLDVFRDHSIETKVLGLLNNVAEVIDLKIRLVNPLCLGIIGRLLKSTKIDVSYFSAGILAHLCADLRWDNFHPSWTECLDMLEQTITEWTQPETEMVAYRSFKPFFSLLSKDHLLAVQLWAVWAIRHVCSKNTERYVDMFKTDGGRQALERVQQATMTTCPLISNICDDVLKLLA